MPTYDEIIEGLNQLLCHLADCGCLLDEDIEEWGNLMLSYRILQSMEESAKGEEEV